MPLFGLGKWDSCTGTGILPLGMGLTLWKMGMGFLFFVRLASLRTYNLTQILELSHLMTQKSQYFSTFWPPIASSRYQALRCGHVTSLISGLFKTNMASSSMSDCCRRTMIIELKYVSSNNAIVHTENSKIELDLKRSPTDLQASIVENCGVKDSAAKRGFGDFVIEFFYVDFVEAGSTKRAPFVLRTKEQVEMLRGSESRSLLVRIIQRVTTFKKASVNIVFEKATETTESTAPGISGSTTSGSTASAATHAGKMPKKAAKKTSIPCTHEKLKDLLDKTDDVKLAEDGKGITCLLYGKTPKLDKSKRTSSGHLKYFRRVHICPAKKLATGPQSRTINDFYTPVPKRPRVSAPAASKTTETSNSSEPKEITQMPECSNDSM